ncbi:Socius [Giardia muris]|uniref:Socius n=1 Tax=Giardia muris TaxID=5742 RepID=A0A4Z1SY07_GIAMU|nr:Socius [Giardia muris]|eukprot:TNJ29695.1 Socius [Giardia muris]
MAEKYRPELPKPVRERLTLQENHDLKRLREQLRGGPVPPAPMGTKAPAQDLVTSMASRLSKVEAENQRLRQMLRRADEENNTLREQIDVCRLASVDQQTRAEELLALKTYIRQLQEQIYGMERFLDKNGLVYIEGSRDDSNENIRSMGQVEEVWSAPSHPVLRKQIEKLNHLVGKDRVVLKMDNGAGYADKEHIKVRFYLDGIFIKRGPFRAYAKDKTAQAFVDDIEAGFLPSEFRSQYPTGVLIDASFEDEPFRPVTIENFKGQRKLLGDETDTPPPPPSDAKSTIEGIEEVARDYISRSEYGMRHNYPFDLLTDDRANMEKPMSVQQFLAKIKPTAMCGGAVVPIKEVIAEMVQGPNDSVCSEGNTNFSQTIIISEAGEENDGVPRATLRIRLNSSDTSLNDKHVLLKLPFNTTIDDVINKIAEALNLDPGRIRLNRPYGSDIMADRLATLEETGCTPNVRLFAKIAV